MQAGAAFDAADPTRRETATWQPSRVTPDMAINGVKDELDYRSRDLAMNDAVSNGALRLQKNSVIGAAFRLNARPNYRIIFGEDSKLARDYGEELAAVAEARFNLAADSEDNWFDAGGMLTFTGLMRLGVGSLVLSGEYVETVLWDTEDRLRPFKTSFQPVSPERLCNPHGMFDTRTLRRGVQMDRRGKPIGFHFRDAYASESYDGRGNTWSYVPHRLKWGRRQVHFIRDDSLIDQTRGISQLVPALSHSRMTKKFSEVTLQRAVIDATYATAIESELPNHEVVSAFGGGVEGWQSALGTYLSMLQGYLGSAENIAVDGVKMPVLFPGNKMRVQPVSAPQGVGQDFEASLYRKIAAILGVSYADLTRDFSKTTYSGLKGELALAERDIIAKKKMWADRLATMRYQAWFEEELAAGNLPLPPGRNRTDFYRPLMKEAYTACAWIGQGRGQIDELKETQAAMLRIRSGLSTLEEECARLGRDYRDVLAQRAKEERAARRLGLSLQQDATRPGNNDVGQTVTGSRGQQDDTDAEADATDAEADDTDTTTDGNSNNE